MTLVSLDTVRRRMRRGGEFVAKHRPGRDVHADAWAHGQSTLRIQLGGPVFDGIHCDGSQSPSRFLDAPANQTLPFACSAYIQRNAGFSCASYDAS